MAPMETNYATVYRPHHEKQESKGEVQRFPLHHWAGRKRCMKPQAHTTLKLAEKSVQIIKNLLTKAKLDNKDPYLSLLEYRNTSVYDIGSPAQLSMSRRLNSLLPCTQEQLTPYVIDPDKVVEVMKRKQEMSKEYYDRGTRQLSVLKANDTNARQMGPRSCDSPS